MQEILVFVIVAAAAFYLGKMLWDAGAGRKSGCNGCGKSCASQSKNATVKTAAGSTPGAGSPLVQIDLNGLSKTPKNLR
jgi:hypothetical protein